MSKKPKTDIGIRMKKGETVNQYLFILTFHQDEVESVSWQNIAKHIRDSVINEEDKKDESTYRKKYNDFRNKKRKIGKKDAENIFDFVDEIDKDRLIAYGFKNKENEFVKEEKEEIEESKMMSEEFEEDIEEYVEEDSEEDYDYIIKKDEIAAKNRNNRIEIRYKQLEKLIESKVKSFNLEPNINTNNELSPVNRTNEKFDNKNKVLYALLSDVHYGIEFDNICGSYNPEIAKHRLDHYCSRIISLGKYHNTNVLYLSLMGDLISGLIHNTIRLENRIDVIDQVADISQLLCDFINRLSKCFKTIHINSVNGNHSRIDQNKNDEIIGENFEKLIFLWCKTAFKNNSNIIFESPNDTYGLFNIFNKNYLSVHGDLDIKIKDTFNRIANMLEIKLDYILAGHTHVAETYFGDIQCIRNGSLCGSGDNYTMKKRLYGPPVQLCLVCTPEGVTSIEYINFKKVK